MICGIDPGASGAIAVLHDDGSIAEIIDMPTVDVVVGGKKRSRVAGYVLSQQLAAWKQKVTTLRAVVERVNAMPGQGTASMFAFGHSAGLVEGILAGLYIPVSLVTPASWKKAMRLPADKGAARMRAMQEWPSQASSFMRVKDDGRAEAALLALYALKDDGMRAAA